ncbi:MAG: MBL fold metallo-hydrolase [bacterium]
MDKQVKVEAFFDPATHTYSYVLTDPQSKACAVIDSVLDFDPAAGRIEVTSAQRIIDYVTQHGLSVQWLLDTHVHADHLSAGRFLQRELGGRTAIGSRVSEVQEIFADVFHVEPEFVPDGSQFDVLLGADSTIEIGGLTGQVIETPGHTPACVTYVFPGIAFVGDTLFMPDYGTARADFPGGDAQALYLSIARILALPDETTLYLCHDYGTSERNEFCCHTTVADQRAHNIHVHDGVAQEDFVDMRQARDKALAAPKLLLPSVQFNMRGGAFPPAESNGKRYFRIPLNLDACGDFDP